MWTVEQVKNIFLHHRMVTASIHLVEQQIAEYGIHSLQDGEMKRYVMNLSAYRLVTTWLMLLDSNERFLVTNHLIEGLDWVKTMIEYENMWKQENGRAERTLKRIQSKALQRIADFMNEEECNFVLPNMNAAQEEDFDG